MGVAPKTYETLQTGAQLMSRKQRFSQFIRDDHGGEVIEYAIVAGLISIVAISVIGAFGVKVLGRWTSINSSM